MFDLFNRFHNIYKLTNIPICISKGRINLNYGEVVTIPYVVSSPAIELILVEKLEKVNYELKVLVMCTSLNSLLICLQ